MKSPPTTTFQGIAGFGIVGAILLAVIFAPFIAPHSDAALVGEVWAPIGDKAWLGLDNLGRDIFSRLLYGGRITLAVAFTATAWMFVLGCTAGFAAAVAGGWVDTVLARACDALMAIPTLIFALVLLSVVGSSIPMLIATLAVLGSTRVFRISRALAGNIAAQEYFEAARLRGEGLIWLIFFEILPNALPPLIAEFGLRLCSGFLFIAALSFLGLGIQPPLADWGGMVRDNASAIMFGGIAPLIPAAAISLFAVGVNLLVNWAVARRAE